MDFSLSNELGPRWILVIALLLFVLSFIVGTQNSVLFYEYLPHRIPEKGIVVFYQPSCPHCIAEVPTIKKLVTEGYPVFTINVLKHPDLAREFNVEATPTIVILPSHIKLVGEQSYASIVAAYEKGVASVANAACGVKTFTCGAT